MPPRRTRAPKPAVNGIDPSTAPISTAPPDSTGGTTLLEALDHIPPAPAGPPLPVKEELNGDTNGSEDDLTPPPALGAAVTPTVNGKATTGSNSTRKRGKKISYAEEEEEPEEDLEVKPVAAKARKKVKREEEEDQDHVDPDELTELDEEVEVPKVTPKKRAKKKAAVAVDGEEPPAKLKKVTPKKSRLAKDEPEFDEEGNEIIKKKRKAKVYEKIVYDIPDVEKKTTTFRGYACLNTVLRSTKPDSIFCSRTCRIASIEEEGMELPKGLALMNCRDLIKMIEWNEQNNIRFLRLSSEMFPFASHDKYGYDLSFADAELKEAGALANKYGHRITMHPGQFTQIGSPKPNVVTASVRELDYQCEILDRMGIDQDGVMIIHMGGIYGDKESTLARFKENFTTRLSDKVKKRLVLENDEICYNVDDLLPLCNELEIPIIFDYHHDWINPSSEPPSVLIPKIAETWKKRGIRMKQHLSEPRPGAESIMEKRAHADRCQNLPPDLPDDVDLMIEAKDKEQAVFELHRMYDLAPVIWDNLRPPDKNPTLQTKGRKSSVKKKVKETGLLDEDGNPIELEDFEKEGDGEMGDEGDAALEERIEELKDVVKAEPAQGNGDVGTEETPKTKRKRAGKKAEVKDEEGIAEPDASPEGKKVTPKRKRGKKAEAASEELGDGLDGGD